jgi:hypothetical protein
MSESFASRINNALNNSDDDEEAEKDDDYHSVPNKNETEFVQNSNSIKLLCAMCIGIKDDKGNAIFDLDDSKYKKLNKREIKPSTGDYATEVEWRMKLYSHDPVRPKNWSMPQCLKWLNDHLIVGEHDVAFMKRAVGEFSGKVLREQEEAQELQQQQQQDATGSWHGKAPYLCLVHDLMEDYVRNAYLRRADAQTRLQLDSCNSEIQEPTAWEMIANRWNDVTFNPFTRVSDCHSDFAVSIDCSYAAVSTLTPATAIKVENILTGWRATLHHIIELWERSGQGDGGHHGEGVNHGDVDVDDDDDEDNVPKVIQFGAAEFGSLHDHPAYALSTRASFLNNPEKKIKRPSYLLYFWEVADEFQFLHSTLQQIAAHSSAADAKSAPSSTNGSCSSSRSGRSDSDSGLVKLAASISGLTQAQLAGEVAEDRCIHEGCIADLRRECCGMKRQCAAFSEDDVDDPKAAALDEEIADIDKEIANEMALLETP